jgi:hypothetical protein
MFRNCNQGSTVPEIPGNIYFVFVVKIEAIHHAKVKTIGTPTKQRPVIQTGNFPQRGSSPGTRRSNRNAPYGGRASEMIESIETRTTLIRNEKGRPSSMCHEKMEEARQAKEIVEAS